MIVKRSITSCKTRQHSSEATMCNQEILIEALRGSSMKNDELPTFLSISLHIGINNVEIPRQHPPWANYINLRLFSTSELSHSTFRGGKFAIKRKNVERDGIHSNPITSIQPVIRRKGGWDISFVMCCLAWMFQMKQRQKSPVINYHTLKGQLWDPQFALHARSMDNNCTSTWVRSRP